MCHRYMSLVGPRPPVPREVALYSLADRRRLPGQAGHHLHLAGQRYSEIDFPGQVLLDVAYIEKQCLLEDIRILVRTPKAVMAGGRAY